ncbi:MAG: hypothetical protein DYG93_11165 [Leptolyngbya sp. PLA2]|nr:hypothetical protein [Leptolyngbya sp.]MCE7972203.1 hypothetical protein [Leptolyngbya sp. PL-A2]MCQ3941219.1 hypothetical protein [cyanobacterium CYA1]MDL1905504.1 hypothetical protein [Synechococcales cyanobacterium CNB]
MLNARITESGRPYPFNATLSVPLPSDADERVEATVQAIRAMVKRSDRMAYVKRLLWEASALGLTAPVHRAAYQAGIPHTLYGVHLVLKRRVRFKRDPVGVELPTMPDTFAATIIANGSAEGDCDDLAALGASMVRNAGYTPTLTVIGRDPKGPYEHIYFGAWTHTGRHVAFDPQETALPGEELPAARKRTYTLHVRQ